MTIVHHRGARRRHAAANSRPILVDGMPVGRVIVLPGGPSFWRILTRLGPTMAPVAAGVLGVGMVLIAFVVFGPARRRLKAVQEATERLGRRRSRCTRSRPRRRRSRGARAIVQQDGRRS